jgi:hypothetical protein
MKALDKIYLNLPIPEKGYEIYPFWTAEQQQNSHIISVEYIRKDALLEWAKENRDSFGRLSYGEFVDKLNEM